MGVGRDGGVEAVMEEEKMKEVRDRMEMRFMAHWSV